MLTRINSVNLNNSYKSNNDKISAKCSINNNFKQPAFKGLPPAYKFSPLIYYWNKLINRSLKASRKYHLSTIPELNGKIEKVLIHTTDKKRLNCWDINPTNSKKYVLFLHGMSQNISHNQPLYKELNKKGYGVFALEYRGFGSNGKAKFNEKKIYKDADAGFNYLKKKTDPKNIGVVGHSAGCLMAANLAKHNKELDQVILIAPVNGFKSFSNRIFSNEKDYFPKSINDFIKKHPILLAPFKNVFKTDAKIAEVECPTKIIHAINDKLIPISSSIELSKKAKNLSHFVTLHEGGHRLDDIKIKTVLEMLEKSK